MGLLSKIGKPGEEVRILAFGDGFKTVEIQKGWTKYARYLSNDTFMEGVELNEAGPLIEKKGNKIAGYLYPVDFDKGQGIKFQQNGDMPVNSYVEEKTFSLDENGNVTPNPDGPIKKRFLVEIYNGVPVQDKKGHVGMARIVKFDITPKHMEIKTNPKLIGHVVASEILSNAIRLKAMRWQIIVASAVCLLLGYMLHG
jgi:hypothetical protein